MLKSIEIWDFESHEHTLVDGLSGGLNLICGESNAGKTSIVRALRLVAYNEFDPKSLRVGAKWCRVKVTSDKGVVQVTRGPKDNLWEITENGKPTKHLDKVGVAAVPDACKVLGLSIVRLGDTDVPVNIMEQLESHFMLAGIGDEKATGSVRAQIIDEISGLSGIEGVIKSVSLDNTRYGREVKKLEKDIEKTQSQLHDQSALDTESRILDEAGKHLKERDEYLLAHGVAGDVHREFEAVSKTAAKLRAELAAIPDVDKAADELDASKDGFEVVSEGNSLLGEFASVKKSLGVLEVELDGIADVDKADACLSAGDKAISQVRTMRGLLDEHDQTTARLRGLFDELKALPDESAAGAAIESCMNSVKRLKACLVFASEYEDLSQDLTGLESEQQANEKELAKAFKERDEIMKSITICPINLGPVSPECLKPTRRPVAKESE